ncbi:MAG: hypothetical protein DRG78_08025 [Epsilonproteobacteria bacterium]|nr:MAG: hypothetical protein DRG78_08025 [Campylobacterota bacterium]
MTINLEILESSYIYDPIQIEELNTKELVPKMVTRRRLTRASKIAIYLASKISSKDERIVYGSSFGELEATSNILHSINDKTMISPTHFQNSVYNTAISYLSMLNNNKSEIITISSGVNTSLKVLQAGAIKALDGDTISLFVIDALNIAKIDELNNCIDFLECGVALKVKVTEEKETFDCENISNNENFPKSLINMLNIAKSINKDKKNIIKIKL